MQVLRKIAALKDGGDLFGGDSMDGEVYARVDP